MDDLSFHVENLSRAVHRVSAYAEEINSQINLNLLIDTLDTCTKNVITLLKKRIETKAVSVINNDVKDLFWLKTTHPSIYNDVLLVLGTPTLTGDPRYSIVTYYSSLMDWDEPKCGKNVRLDPAELYELISQKAGEPSHVRHLLTSLLRIGCAGFVQKISRKIGINPLPDPFQKKDIGSIALAEKMENEKK